MEVIDFIWDNYPALRVKGKREDIKKLIKLHRDKLVVVGDIQAVGFYYRLPNKILKWVKAGRFNLTHPPNAKYCLNCNGFNVHFVFTVSKGFKYLREGIRKVINKERPDTVSWFSPEMKLFIRRL